MSGPTQPDLDALRDEIAKLRQTLANLDDMAGQGIPVAEARSHTQERLDDLQAQITAQGDVQGDLIGRDKFTALDQRDAHIGTQIVYTVAPQPPPPDEAAALDGYLRHVVQSNRRLRLQGIRSAGRLVSIDLEQIYVTLNATVRRAVEQDDARPEHHRQVEIEVKVEVQEALDLHPRLVVLGNPGCGKTTLLRYLALTYARDLLGEAGLVAQRLELAERRLPVLLPLRDLARHLERQHPDPGADGPRLLLDYLHIYFANQDLALPGRFFANYMKRGECVVLLDGVDEVADPATRRRVSRLVERLTLAYPGNRYVVTSRVVGYAGAARLGEGYAVTTVRDFSQADVECFVGYWNRAVEAALAGGDETAYTLQEAKRQGRALLGAIRGNERVRELAVNPLLLTVIALVQRYRAQLPERRTELYEEVIEVLLGKWDEAKGLETETLLVGHKLDAGDRRGMLEPIALWMMEQHTPEIEAQELQQQLYKQFHKMGGDSRQATKAADAFLQLISERSGLLIERGYGVYAFNHLTFQEHLAARAVADRPDYIAYTLARLGDSWWREVILLEAGYLSTQGKSRVTNLIQTIMNHKDEPEPYYNLVLAADALRDVGPARVEGDLLGEVQRRLQQGIDRGSLLLIVRFFGRLLLESSAFRWVYSTLIRGYLLPEGLHMAALRMIGSGRLRRNAAARALAGIGSGVYWTKPHGEPEWVDVPAGEFWMGGEKLDSEKPIHRVRLERFQIARVPITNAQYRIFVEATGHDVPNYWDDNRPPRGLDSHPIVQVNWYDAMAYCHWLSEIAGKPITLPSEAQWEKAARGDKDQREYPWGNEWDETYCNSVELNLDNTTPVGIFSRGASPYGCMDMAGNVWEWTISLWGEDFYASEFNYPYNSTDGRENLAAEENVCRVFRGGSFSGLRLGSRCAYRNGNRAFFRWRGLGFRVVISTSSLSGERMKHR